ncbi:hypothetical protein HQ545_03255 [Candidatus Woesearchaeota archaeon]|nr:hypothetical protein [Candidatus Woesearchaeota archaeon]
MIKYTLGQDMIFIILALIAALGLLSKHTITAISFFTISLLFVIFEHKIYDYVKSA